MQAAEVRKLIGKTVTWMDTWCPKRGSFLQKEGVVLDVKGRSVLVDRQGSNDWMQIEDMRLLQLKNAATPGNGGNGS